MSEAHDWTRTSVFGMSSVSWHFGVQCKRCQIKTMEILPAYGKMIKPNAEDEILDILTQDLLDEYGSDCSQVHNFIAIRGVHES